MKKNKRKQQWFNFNKLDAHDVAYKIAIGERSNGKTFAGKGKKCIDKFVATGARFLYVRRKHSQVTRKHMVKLFEDISDYAEDMLNDYIKYTPDTGFYVEDGDENRIVIGYATSVEDSSNLKGVPLNDVKTILFDEFLEYGASIEDEISKFLNVVSTVVRKRDDVEIIMLANTVTKYSPYFELFGIDPKKLKQGKVYTVHHLGGVSAAIEYCRTSNIVDGVKIGNKYLGFDDNPISDMILYGEWEYESVNTKGIDAITWNSNRYLVPYYITAIGEVFELSLYEGDDPALFVRKINTQDGIVRKEIKYNLSYDNSLKLNHSDGTIVPIYGKVSPLMGQGIIDVNKMCLQCIEAKRVVFDKYESGGDFMKIYKEIM